MSSPAGSSSRCWANWATTTRRCVTLRETLRLYLARGRSRQQVAAEMYINRNTVAYRVQKPLKLLGGSIDEDAFDVRLALEADRLHVGRGRLEFMRTQDVLRRLLPPGPARVLDVGGGAGAHARWLAADGYQVRLVDPMPLHVQHSGAIAGVDAVLGDV